MESKTVHKLTYEEYQALSDDERLEYGMSLALERMAKADAVIVTDKQGQHWEVDPRDILPAEYFDETEYDQASGFSEPPKPFRWDD